MPGGAPEGRSAGAAGSSAEPFANPPRARLADTHLGSYLFFDIQGFLSQPFLVASRPDTGSGLLLNSFLKSSLFGTFGRVPEAWFSIGPYAELARLLNAALVGFVLMALLGFVRAKRTALKGTLALAVFMAAFLAVVVAIRVVTPRASCGLPTCSSCARRRRAGRRECMDRVSPRGTAAVSRRDDDGTGIGAGPSRFSCPVTSRIAAMTTHVIERPLQLLAHPLEAGLPSSRARPLFWRDRGRAAQRACGTRATRLDVSLDRTDSYEIEIVGERERRKVAFVPYDGRTGLVRHTWEVTPPVEEVKYLLVRPTAGDGAYAVGHLTVVNGESRKRMRTARTCKAGFGRGGRGQPRTPPPARQAHSPCKP